MLRFFAGAIIRILYLAGADEDLLWKSCNPEYRVKFLKCLKEFPETWALAFHWYETERHGQRNSRTTPDGDERSIKASGTSCRVINSVTIGPHTFEHDSILVLTTLESLVFILSTESTLGCLQFIDIPKQCILQPTQCDAASRYKHVVSFYLDAAGSFIINGKAEQLSGSIHIASDTDFTDLPLSTKRPEPRPAVRRPSSMFISLDTADEVARKSKEYRKKTSQVGQERESLSKSTDNYGCEELPPTPDDLGKEHEKTCLTSTVGKNVESPLFHDGIPKPSSLNENMAPDSDPRSEDIDGMSPISTDSESPDTQEEMPNESANHPNQRERPEKSPANGRQPPCRKKKSTLPDTQEPLVFHRLRRSPRNVYKGHPGPPVDWEEDLRPTPSQDERPTGRESQNDAELSSISSPDPGDVSVFDKSLDTQRKKRRAQYSTSKEHPRKKRVPGMPRLPLEVTEVNDDKIGVEKNGGQLPCDITESDEAVEGRSSESHEPDTIATRAGECASPANQSTASVDSQPKRQDIDQSGQSVFDLSIERVPGRPSDPVLESHPTQNNGIEIDHEPTETQGISLKETGLKRSSTRGSGPGHVLSSRKMQPSGSACAKQNKKLRFDVETASSESRQSGTKRVRTDENGEEANKRIKVTSVESGSPASESESDLDSQDSTSIEEFTPSQRRYIVDETGSPKPLSRHPDQGSRIITDAKFKKALYRFDDSSGLPGDDVDSNDSTLTDRSLSHTNNAVSQKRPDCPLKTTRPLPLSSNETSKGSSAMITPISIPKSPHRAQASRIDKGSNVNDGENWESSLETLQKVMHDILRDTSKASFPHQAA